MLGMIEFVVFTGNTLLTVACLGSKLLIRQTSVKTRKQGRIHGYPGRGQVGRISAREGTLGIWAGAESLKSSKTPKK